MTPYEQAAQLFAASGSRWSFAQFLEAHAVSGYVWIRPDVFMLARAVNADWSDADLRDPALFSTAPDCWHCSLFAGDLSLIPSLVPFPLPFVSYHRKGKLRVLAVEALLSRLHSAGDEHPGHAASEQPGSASDS